MPNVYYFGEQSSVDLTIKINDQFQMSTGNWKCAQLWLTCVITCNKQ